MWRAYVAQQHFSNRGQWWTTGKLRALKRWGLTFVVGVVQAIIAVVCNLASKKLATTKYDHVYDLLEYNTLKKHGMMTSAGDGAGGGVDESYYTADGYLDVNQDGIPDSEQESESANLSDYWFNFGNSPFLAFLFYQTVFAIAASLFVYIEPVSGGSGIPEVKCFLNGIDLPRIVRIKTLICKVVGVTFSVAAGLPVGKEGPMVHSGSVVAASISQGRTKFWGVDTSFSKFADFRNDREKRGESFILFVLHCIFTVSLYICTLLCPGALSPTLVALSTRLRRVRSRRWRGLCFRSPHRWSPLLPRGGCLLLVDEAHLACLLLCHDHLGYTVCHSQPGQQVGSGEH